MRDLLGVGVLAANLGDANVSSLAGLGECIVAAVEVLALLGCASAGYVFLLAAPKAYLELVLQKVLLVRQLSVQTEELGLLRRHFLCSVRFWSAQRMALPEGQQCEHLSCAGAANDVR